MQLDKLVIIHFAPLELYPPIQNLLRTLEGQSVSLKLYTLTTRSPFFKLPPFHLSSQNSKIIRIGISSSKLVPVVRYWNYFLYFGFSILFLVLKRPQKILYFETISSWPAIVYKKIINTSCEIFIHYHEYTSPKEYSEGMILNRYFHKMEKEFYKNARWVSHTNEFRMDKLKNDIKPITIQHPFVLPNFPPSSWRRKPKVISNFPVKFVYVGSLSLNSMYAQEFAEWINNQNGRATWDIYSYNYSEEAKEFFSNLNTRRITLHSGVSYYDLVSLLEGYDIGMVLYRGVSDNHIFSVSNKVFEYLAAGLSVWFPSEIVGTYEYQTVGTYPMICKLDFSKLESQSIETMLTNDNLIESETRFYCENSLKPLIDLLTYQS